MKIRLIMIGPLFALLGAVVAEAQQTVDVSKIACEQFLLGRPFELKDHVGLAERLLPG